MKNLSVSMSPVTLHGLAGNCRRQAAGAQAGGMSGESYELFLELQQEDLVHAGERDLRKLNRLYLSSVKLLAFHTKRLD